MTNIFSGRSRGFRPTPSACYPPPPPPATQNITGWIKVEPVTLPTGTTYHVTWFCENLNVPVGEPAVSVFTVPGLLGTQQDQIINGQLGHTSGIVGQLLGLHTARLHVTWSNNQNRTFTCLYQITA